jgi:hypothetical protein
MLQAVTRFPHSQQIDASLTPTGAKCPYRISMLRIRVQLRAPLAAPRVPEDHRSSAPAKEQGGAHDDEPPHIARHGPLDRHEHPD